LLIFQPGSCDKAGYSIWQRTGSALEAAELHGKVETTGPGKMLNIDCLKEHAMAQLNDVKDSIVRSYL
jgi:hypothetical protein